VTHAAIGFRAHSGWAALVALTLEGGEPMVLSRRRIHLVETFTYTFRQPYHTAQKMAPDEARAFISQVELESKRLAYRAIREVHKTLATQGYPITHCGLTLASGRPLPALPKILSSHALIHTADGELFRRAILHAGSRCGLANTTMRERELLGRASEILRIKLNALIRCVANLGRGLGPPWSQDEKLASLVAWLALVSQQH
jgi:hypothetical protein